MSYFNKRIDRKAKKSIKRDFLKINKKFQEFLSLGIDQKCKYNMFFETRILSLEYLNNEALSKQEKKTCYANFNTLNAR